MQGMIFDHIIQMAIGPIRNTAIPGFPITIGAGHPSTMAAGLTTIITAGSGFPAMSGVQPGLVGAPVAEVMDGRRLALASPSAFLLATATMYLTIGGRSRPSSIS